VLAHLADAYPDAYEGRLYLGLLAPRAASIPPRWTTSSGTLPKRRSTSSPCGSPMESRCCAD